MSGRRWSDEDKTLIAGMKRAGMTNKAIAERMGTTPGMIEQIRSKRKAYRRLDHKGGHTFAPVHAVTVR